MSNFGEIQFDGSSCGHHGPYTFFRSFSFSANLVEKKRSIAIGEFFFVRILAELPVCIAELQLLWESKRTVGTKLASVKLYFTPEDTPTGRQLHHGEDELLVADEKVVLEIEDLVKWIVEDLVSWPYGYHVSSESSGSVAKASGGALTTAAANGCHGAGVRPRTAAADTKVIITGFPQYCRFRAIAKRLESGSGTWGQSAVVQAMGGISTTGGDVRFMFCRDTFEHPILALHDFRKDGLAPKLKGRKRRKRFSRQESMESVDSDLGLGSEKLSAVLPEDGAAQKSKPVAKCSAKVRLTLPAPGLELINAGKEAFEQKLYKFMKERKTPIKRIPSLGFKEVDLFQFFIYSQKFGGYDKVTEGRHWKQIYDQMGGHPGNTSAATCTRRTYEKLLLMFERHIRGEEDKPLPVTYMRPARKRLQEHAASQNKPVAKVLPTTINTAEPMDTSSPSCISAISQASKKQTEAEALNGLKIEIEPLIRPPAESVIRSAESVIQNRPVDVSGDVDSGQPTESNVQAVEVQHEKASLPICKVKCSSPDVKNSSNENLKEHSQEDGVLPVTVPPPFSTALALSTSSSSELLGNRSDASLKPTSFAVGIEPKPVNKKENTMPQVLPSTAVLPSVIFKTTSSTTSSGTIAITGQEIPKGMLFSTGTIPVSNTVTCDAVRMDITSLNSFLPLFDPKLINKNATRLPLNTRFMSPSHAVDLPFTRPTYGPPNLLDGFSHLSNGQVEVLSVSKSATMSKPVLPLVPNSLSSGTRLLGIPQTMVYKEAEEAASPRKSDTVGSSPSSGSWFNSPIKQFLDRTRAATTVLRSQDVDDQPVDLSMKSQTALGKSQDQMLLGNCFQGEQNEPLNLSKKQEHRAASHGLRAPGMDLVAATKKPTTSSGDVGKVILPKSDKLVPLILSVPSLKHSAAQPIVVGSVPSLSIASLPNKPPIKAGLAAVPTILSPAPFPTSFVGAALPPVLQFFPSPGLPPNVAYASEPGRPLLLRFPLPVPVSAPLPTTQPPIIVPKTNRS